MMKKTKKQKIESVHDDEVKMIGKKYEKTIQEMFQKHKLAPAQENKIKQILHKQAT
tara:strand:- start:123 stop:290 length:168 start_codon:yes stop_codon:yes gene_type:complete